MRILRQTLAILGFLVAIAPSARADATVFVGTNTTPDNRLTRGGAIGAGLLIVGFEFEYSATVEDAAAGAPSLRMGSANGILQTPIPVFGLQFYVTAGGGIYREQLGASRDTGFAPNVGGGVKWTLAGPLRVRLDYRSFKLGSGASYSPSHRLYAGLNLKF